MKKLMLLAFSVGLFLMGSQAKAERREDYAVRTATIAFSSAAVVVNAKVSLYWGCSYSTGTNNVDFLSVYNSSKSYNTSTDLKTCAGKKMFEDYNVSVTTTPFANGVASTKFLPRPIKLDAGLTVAPSVHTYNFITVFWSDPNE